MMGSRTLVAACLWLLLAPLATAGSPTVTSVLPRGGQRGTEVILTIAGNRLQKPQGLFLHRPGIEVLEVKAVSATRVTLRIRIADDAPLGEHPFNVRTSAGISSLWTFRVGVLPEVTEKEGNNGPKAAQSVPFDVTINGTIQAEDEDTFAVNVPEGRLSIEVEGLRLGQVDCDLRFDVVGPDDRTVATAEDSALGVMDPWVSLPHVKAGRYLIRLRETAWGGSSAHHYRLHVGDFPRPAGALPTGITTGNVAALRYVGSGSAFTERVEIPANAGHPYGHFPADSRGMSPTPIWLMRSTLRNYVEPIGAGASTTDCASPCAVSGVLSKPGEVDHWRLTLKKGDRLRIISGSRALRSPLDSVIFIRDKSRVLATNDDTRGSPDSSLTFSVREDGVYRVGVRDHMRRGGPDYFYRITIGPRPPVARTAIDTPRNETPTWISVPRGGRMACVLRASGINRDDGLEYHARHLPPGTRASPARLHASSPYVPFVISADKEAALGGSLVALDATAAKAPKSRPSNYQQSIPLVRVENNRVYLRTEADRIPVAVCDALPFRVDVVAPKVPVVRGSGFGLRIKLHRDKGFKTPVQIRLLYNPPGIRGGVITIPGDKTEGVLPLSQAGGVPEVPWDVVVVGRANLNGIVETCSEIIQLPVVSPYYITTIGKARAAQGEDIELPVTLRMREKFSGKVAVRVPNLPRDVKIAFTEIDEKSTSLTCKLNIGPKAPPGRYRNLLFQFIVPTPGGNAVQTVRGGELRIDRPRKPTKGVATKKPPGKKRAWGTITNPKT